MQAQGISSEKELYSEFIARVTQAVIDLGRTPIVWEGFPKVGAERIPRETIVIAWESHYHLVHDLLEEGFRVIGAMFTGFSSTAATAIALHQILNLKTVMFLIGGCVFCTPLAKKIPCPYILRCIGCLALYFLCLAALASGGFTPFIYFQF
jgi:hypothetical protein